MLENKVEIMSPVNDAVEKLCSLIPKEERIPINKILMGDALYEEVF